MKRPVTFSSVGRYSRSSTHSPKSVNEKSNDGHPKDGSCQITGVAEVLEHMVVTTSEVITQDGEGGAPNCASDEGEQCELCHGHLAQSSGEGDEGAHQRNDPPDEDQNLPSTSEPRVSPVEVSMGNEHVLAEAIDEQADRLVRRRNTRRMTP